MAKEKLFTPEDFDKPKDKNFWQKYKGWIIGICALLIIVAIVLCCVFCDKSQDKEEVTEQGKTKQVAVAETQVNNEGSETVESEPTSETQEVEQVEEQPATAPNVSTPKEDLNPQTAPKPATQPANVSDNIEQEAMNVIRGDYGNVPERREKLGSKYQQIQNRVNELKLKGVF